MGQHADWRSVRGYLRGNDRFNVYYRGSVFTEPGNWVLDGVLLLIEVLLVWFGARRIIRAAGYAASVV